MFRIIQKRKIWYGLSLLVLIPGMVSLILWGLRLGNDFTGGSLLEYKFSKLPEISAISDALTPIDQETVDKITKAVQEKYPDSQMQSFESIGPTIGAELRQRAFMMTGLVLLGILLYVTYVFRGVSKNSPVSSWAFGGATIVALFHDALIVIGFERAPQ